MTDNTVSERTVQTLALCRYGKVAPRLFEALLHHFGNVERIVKADSGTLMAIDGMEAAVANRVSQASDHFDDAVTYLKLLQQKNVEVVTRFDEEYPQGLFDINDPPSLLYIRGRLPENDRKRVALVGADQVTNEGIALTVEAAAYFARSQTQVISSLYRGIDLSAHIGCQREREASFAVCETGFDDIRADDAVPIAIAIASQGGLISEYTPETSISRGGFKQSNRILAGMVQAVVITELYSHSARTLDLLKFCHQIGKLAFILIDPEQGVLSDEAALKESVTYGALPMVGKDKLQDIAMSLV